MVMSGRLRWPGLLPAVLLWGCLDVAEDRARIDARVGSAQGGAGSVRVEGGRAAVRAFAEGELHLWASAPGLSITLDPLNPRVSMHRRFGQSPQLDYTSKHAVDLSKVSSLNFCECYIRSRPNLGQPRPSSETKCIRATQTSERWRHCGVHNRR